MGAELLHADMMLTVDFRNFANAPKNYDFNYTANRALTLDISPTLLLFQCVNEQYVYCRGTLTHSLTHSQALQLM